ncbi:MULTISPECIES: quinone oxidoreductase family protein [Bacillota]|uniref:quinone oxidoreductase family protein n=1 Tax=Bacillota TaxID=1239 RepID=UPI000D0117DC|nr:NADP-dependent oxidoreductase [Mammaliicoccus sciuri]AVL76287.1 NADP-dependent oxidoreductase [Staphylococcus cohnii]
MRAITLNEFGNAEKLNLNEVNLPKINENEVLIKLFYAGIGQWDIFEREGGYEKMLNLSVDFPYILGSEGVGEIIKIGKNVKNYKIGDIVCAVSFLNSKGGFYAEYVAVPDSHVYLKPRCLSYEESSAISGIGLTAYRGLVDVLNIKKNDNVLIHGASGGVGHIAIQIAKSFGANIFAIVSGNDGIRLAKSLGVNNVVDGKNFNSQEIMSMFDINQFDSAFFTTGGIIADQLVENIKPNGKVVFPYGIQELNIDRSDLTVKPYYADIDLNLLTSFLKWINSNQPTIHVDKVFDLDEYKSAHLALEQHYVGKLCFSIFK